MVKTLKEYLGVPTIRVGGLDAMQPMASLSRKGTDIAPKVRVGEIQEQSCWLQIIEVVVLAL